METDRKLPLGKTYLGVLDCWGAKRISTELCRHNLTGLILSLAQVKCCKRKCCKNKTEFQLNVVALFVCLFAVQVYV